jgi:hypothetical protein
VVFANSFAGIEEAANKKPDQIGTITSLFQDQGHDDDVMMMTITTT